MPQFFSSNTPTTSFVLSLNGFSRPSFQLSVEGAGAVAAQAIVEGGHDGRGWIPIATITASGNVYATDGGPVETNWPLMRARLLSVSGGTATLNFSL
ncbi:hypothetical protein [Pseudomonas sp. PSKL.D1]|uniref:hypothetical protein n=1 Tax=Pseudomonas sp. PSKL.D1 TaxID=3029060 RepID=UPI002380C746|nr:hypothetical protein [Pseudomonas sp. PSKL.D1]WDY60399.1 hypothetical protein PVV54_12460 [Pseudomonas sp. PSKL.D1]